MVCLCLAYCVKSYNNFPLQKKFLSLKISRGVATPPPGFYSPVFPVTSEKFICKDIDFTIFHLSPVFFDWKFRICFISTEKWNKKGKYPDGVQIFTFSLEHRIVWRQRFPKEIWQMITWSENVFKGNLMLQFSWLEEFR